jgi:hypothetical protein
LHLFFFSVIQPTFPVWILADIIGAVALAVIREARVEKGGYKAAAL